MNDNFAHRAAEWDSPAKIEMAEQFVSEMMKYVRPEPHWKAFEIGAGTGLVGMQVLSQVGSMVFEDTSAAMLDVLKQKPTGGVPVETVHGEILDYKTKDIDWAFSCMAFHHIPDIPLALHHLFEILRPGAIVVVGDLLTEDGSFHRFEPIPHKGFDSKWLIAHFRDAGFVVDLMQPYHELKRERSPGVVTSYVQFVLVARKPA